MTARASRARGKYYCAAFKDTLLHGRWPCYSNGPMLGHWRFQRNTCGLHGVCVQCVCVCARLNSLICTFAVCKICSVPCGVMCDLAVLQRVTGRFAVICQFIFIPLLIAALLSVAYLSRMLLRLDHITEFLFTSSFSADGLAYTNTHMHG